ncbi:hypothetical protein GCM10020331_059430 [Ectobacillus funiculus]
MVKHDKDRESLIETMDRYDKIMQRVAARGVKPAQRLELTIDGTVYTHLTEEEFFYRNSHNGSRKNSMYLNLLERSKKKMKTGSGNLP